jgi:hypothetical protein
MENMCHPNIPLLFKFYMKIKNLIFNAAILLSTLFYAQELNAQMSAKFPNSFTKTTIKEHSTISAEIENETAVYSMDTSSYLYLESTRSNAVLGVGDQNSVKVRYAIDFPTEDKNIYIIYDHSDSGLDYLGYHGRLTINMHLGGTFYRLFNGSTLITEANVRIDDLVTQSEKHILKLRATQPVTHLEIEVKSATTSTYVRWFQAYSIFTVQGSISAADCGIPIAARFEGKINGVPLAGPAI